MDRCTLWQRLRAFDLDHDDDDAAADEGPTLSFTTRLARENGWRLPYAARVIDEYKRFLFLAVASGHAVTPSEAVDQAWHLHLVYTRSYWNRLCRDLLGRPLHHGPTRGGRREADRYAAQYRATLASYERLFGERPPDNIWSHPTIRFGVDLRWRRIWTSRVYVIPKPSPRRLAAFIAFIALIAGIEAWSDSRISPLPNRPLPPLLENAKSP